MTAINRASYLALLCGLVLSASLCLLLCACEKEYSPKNAEQARTNLDSIASALERYARDHKGCYPSVFDDLAKEAYLTALPFNAYQKPMLWLKAPKMRSLPPGAPPSNGDFVYIPGASSGTPGTCKDYRLYLYGDLRDVDKDEKIVTADGVIIDRVILVIIGERASYVPGSFM